MQSSKCKIGLRFGDICVAARTVGLELNHIALCGLQLRVDLVESVLVRRGIDFIKLIVFFSGMFGLAGMMCHLSFHVGYKLHDVAADDGPRRNRGGESPQYCDRADHEEFQALIKIVIGHGRGGTLSTLNTSKIAAT